MPRNQTELAQDILLKLLESPSLDMILIRARSYDGDRYREDLARASWDLSSQHFAESAEGTADDWEE